MADEPQKDFKVETLVQEHGKDISGLSEKLGKCFSEEKYENFQTAVKKITLETLDIGGTGGGQEKIKAYAIQAIRDYNRDDNWRKISFWIPIIVSVIAIAVAYVK